MAYNMEELIYTGSFLRVVWCMGRVDISCFYIQQYNTCQMSTAFKI